MAEFQLIMPKMGESIAEATIIRWVKNEGDTIAADETVLEIATDKVDSEVPSPKGGVLKKRLFKENDVVAVGAVIAIIETEVSASATPAAPAAPASPAKVETPVAQVEKTIAVAEQLAKPALTGGSRFYSPLVLNIAKEENISMAELETIAGTGNEGRVTKRDILAHIQNKGVAVPTAKSTATDHKASVSAPVNIPQPPKVSLSGGDEIIEMDRMRKLISDHMVMSKHTSPHVERQGQESLREARRRKNYVYSNVYRMRSKSHQRFSDD